MVFTTEIPVPLTLKSSMHYLIRNISVLFSETFTNSKTDQTARNTAVGEKMLDDFEGVLIGVHTPVKVQKFQQKLCPEKQETAWKSATPGQRTATGEQYTVYRTAIGQNGLKSLLTLSPLTVLPMKSDL